MIDVQVPFEQEGTKAVVRAWLKRVGDWVEENDPLVELETDKVTQEVPAPAAGMLSEILLDSDDEATPGAILGRIDETGGKASVETQAEPESGLALSGTALASSAASVPSVIGLSPAVRRAIKQHGVDPNALTGTGRGGRITRADVDEAVASSREPAAEKAAPAAHTPPAPASASAPASAIVEGAARAIPHDRMRLAIAHSMLNSVTVAPHVTAVFECDFSAISAHRRASKAAFEAQGAKLTFTAYLVAASAQAMQAAPTVNSRWFADRLEVYDDVGVGIGTALGDKGLVVPVVQRAQALSLLGIAQRLTDMTTRARKNALTPADMRGGTFAISNHGVSGSLLAAPIIINQPQSAILGVGKLEKRVVVRDVSGADAMVIKPMAYVSLTIDHRVLDGHQTNAWLTRFVEVLETWPLED